MAVHEATAQVGPNVLGCMTFSIFQHLRPCLTRLGNEGRALLDSVGGLADCVHHERVRADAELLRSVGCALLELIGELE